MKRVRLTPTQRREQLMSSAIKMARKHGYAKVTRALVAADAGCSEALPSVYWGTIPQMRRAIMREAVRAHDLAIIGQGLAVRDPNALKAPPELKQRALASLMN